MDEATLAGIEEGYRARRFCGVCLGSSPSWDGHDVDPACWGHVVESIPALVAEVRRLSAALAEQQRIVGHLTHGHPDVHVRRVARAVVRLVAAAPSGEPNTEENR